jgi:hypothetical protein
VGNSHMYQVLRTERLDEAYALARELIGHAVTVQDAEAFALTGIDGLHRFAPLGTVAGVDFHTSLRVPAARAGEVRRRLEGRLRRDQVLDFKGGDRDILDLDPSAAPLLSDVEDLILGVDAEDAPDLVMEQPFLAAVAETDVAQLYWSVIWPEVPARGLLPNAKYDGVEILIHTPSLFSEEWCDTHSVWVHCRSEERAQWAAERVGATVLSGPHLGR